MLEFYVFAMFVLMPIGIVIVILGERFEERKTKVAAQKREAAKLAAKAKQEQKSNRTSTSGDVGDDGPVYWATGNYDPERYYRETQGWSRDFTNYVRDAYGDLDTYESNHPD